MTKTILLILSIGITTIQACKERVITPQNLEGVWVEQGNGRHVFAFTDNRCSYINPTGSFATYNLSDNVISVKDTMRRRSRIIPKEFKFQISQLSQDQMVLITDSTTLSTHFKYGKASDVDTFRLTRKRPNYQNGFSTISFESTGCYGTCPEMKLTVDRLGNISYEGRAYTDMNGYYTGRVPQRRLHILIDKINSINLDSIKEDYRAMWTDDQTCKLEINTTSRSIRSTIYGFDKEPIEVRILINELMDLYKSSNIQLDSLHKYYFDGSSQPNTY